jgi:release factor glutamine methyltransferase
MLEWGTEYFQKKEVNSPRMSVEWLLSDVLNVKRLDLYLMYDRPLSAQELDTLRPLIKRRAEHEPLQYITGSTPFVHSRIKVNKNVLIPRMETEYMVELILHRFENGNAFKMLDVGTGSGCIPIAIKKERPDWEVEGFDLSDEAVKLARLNADENECEIRFFQDDLFRFSPGTEQKYNLITSNPPYVLEAEKEGLHKEVRDYEPHLALFTDDTRRMYHRLAELVLHNLKKGGSAYIEINSAEASKVLECFQYEEFEVRIDEDQEGRKRYLILERTV